MIRFIKIIGIFAIISFFVGCFQPKRDCKSFHTGSFVFEQEINGEKHQSFLERGKDYQIETYKGVTDTANVRWINDCEFVLTKLHPKNREETKSIHMKILTTTEDGYIFEYGIVGETKKQRGEVKIRK